MGCRTQTKARDCWLCLSSIPINLQSQGRVHKLLMCIYLEDSLFHSKTSTYGHSSTWLVNIIFWAVSSHASGGQTHTSRINSLQLRCNGLMSVFISNHLTTSLMNSSQFSPPISEPQFHVMVMLTSDSACYTHKRKSICAKNNPELVWGQVNRHTYALGWSLDLVRASTNQHSRPTISLASELGNFATTCVGCQVLLWSTPYSVNTVKMWMDQQYTDCYRLLLSWSIHSMENEATCGFHVLGAGTKDEWTNTPIIFCLLLLWLSSTNYRFIR